ncbi:dTMP kinase [bacterium]|nr:dTMP kinase [bacterium]
MKFFVFEGLDGAGKSTLIQKVEDYLRQKSLDVSRVRDPGSTEIGEKLRHVILSPEFQPSTKTEVLLYQAARAQLVAEKIKPQLQKGIWVLSDRFYSSTIAFQCFARGLNREDIQWLSRYACDGLEPDLVIFIDIPVEESERRVQQRTSSTGTQKDRMENENHQFHEKVRQGYLAQAKENPKHWLVIDGFLKPDELFEKVLQYFRTQKWLD